ncbi:MAG: hypothetical protein ACK5NG_12110 [Chthoniobacterales bacterium]
MIETIDTPISPNPSNMQENDHSDERYAKWQKFAKNSKEISASDDIKQKKERATQRALKWTKNALAALQAVSTPQASPTVWRLDIETNTDTEKDIFNKARFLFQQALMELKKYEVDNQVLLEKLTAVLNGDNGPDDFKQMMGIIERFLPCLDDTPAETIHPELSESLSEDLGDSHSKYTPL